MRGINLTIVFGLLLFSLLNVLFAQTYDRGQYIVAAEYFIGTDPGEGNGTPLDGNFYLYDVTVSFDLNVPEGTVIYIRFKSSNGLWSAPKAYVYTHPVPARGAYIKRAEYFINTDPGVGNGTPITVDAAGNLQPFTLTNLNPGDRVYIRIMDSYDRWSAPAQKEYVYPPTNRGGNLVAAEYFVNVDPGVGNGKPVTIDNYGNIVIDELPLARGDRIYIRFKDSFNRWGPATWFEYSYQDIVEAEYRFMYNNGMLSPIYEMEMKEHLDPTLAFFTALSKDTISPSVSNQIDTVLVRFKTDYIVGNWYKFAYDEIDVTAIQDWASLPKEFKLYPNSPNPFNPSTEIRYDIPHSSDVLLEIYNVLGEKVRTLVNERQKPGRYVVRWHGRNDSGTPVAAGLYLCRIKTDEYVRTIKLILVK